MKLPPVKVPKIRKPRDLNIPAPRRPSLDNGDEAELLAGEVMGMKASAPEERMAKALGKAQVPFEFRYTVGAPRGLPGWKEIDFVASKNGMVYPIEVDTEFTHRNKGKADRLHDAIVLSELEQQGYQVYPQVIHVMGETDLVDQRAADATAKRLFQ